MNVWHAFVAICLFWPAAGLGQNQNLSIDGGASLEHQPDVLFDQGLKPIVQITAPKQGTSVNRFTEFVTTHGALYGNALEASLSSDGKLVPPNSNLASTGPANTIVIDNTGRTILRGTHEIVGNTAALVHIGKKGAVCDDCRTSNTNRFLLGAGDFDTISNEFISNGRSAVVRGKGLYADGDLDIAAELVLIDGPTIAAGDVAIYGGPQKYNLNDFSSNGNGKAGSTSEYAVHVTEHGSVSGAQIKIHSFGQNAGVRIPGNLHSSIYDVIVNSEGGAYLGGIEAARDAKVFAAGKMSVGSGRVISARHLQFDTAGAITVHPNAKMVAGAALKINAGESIVVAGELESQSAHLVAQRGLFNLGTIVARGDVSIVAGEIRNQNIDARLSTAINTVNALHLPDQDFASFQSSIFNDLMLEVREGQHNQMYLDFQSERGILAGKNLSAIVGSGGLHTQTSIVAGGTISFDVSGDFVLRSAKTGRTRGSRFFGIVGQDFRSRLLDYGVEVSNELHDALGQRSSQGQFRPKVVAASGLQAQTAGNINVSGAILAADTSLLLHARKGIGLSGGHFGSSFIYSPGTVGLTGQTIAFENVDLSAKSLVAAARERISLSANSFGDLGIWNKLALHNLSFTNLGSGISLPFLVDIPGHLSVDALNDVVIERKVDSGSVRIKSRSGAVVARAGIRSTYGDIDISAFRGGDFLSLTSKGHTSVTSSNGVLRISRLTSDNDVLINGDEVDLTGGQVRSQFGVTVHGHGNVHLRNARVSAGSDVDIVADLGGGFGWITNYRRNDSIGYTSIFTSNGGSVSLTAAAINLDNMQIEASGDVKFESALNTNLSGYISARNILLVSEAGIIAENDFGYTPIFSASENISITSGAPGDGVTALRFPNGIELGGYLKAGSDVHLFSKLSIVSGDIRAGGNVAIESARGNVRANGPVFVVR